MRVGSGGPWRTRRCQALRAGAGADNNPCNFGRGCGVMEATGHMAPTITQLIAAMKSLRSLAIVSGLSLALSAALHAAESEAGYIDIGKLLPSAKGEFVEVNLSPGMLKFAAKIAARHEPEAADLIGNLKHIRVNVVGLDESNRSGNIEKIEAVRRKLEAQGWTQMVTVREKDDGDNVDVHVMQRGEDAIDGLVVTVIDKKGEAVFVNIVGNISADQIAKIADKFDIEPLKHVHVKFDHKPKEKDA